MSSIVLGTHDGKNVKADLEVLMNGRLLVTANSGAGKTFLLKRVVEQAFGKIQVIVIDPEGEFSPLREKFPFIIVGKSGDVAADVKTAPLLAHRLLETRLSAVCDIYEMRPDDRHAWVAAFCTALVEAPKAMRHPCLVLIDEAHIFAPEQGDSVALQPFSDLASRGRKRGLCIVCATQRLSALSKMVTGLLQNRLIGAMFEDIDVKRAAENLGIGKGDEYRAFAHQLRMLEPGNFWAMGRAISKERILFKVGAIETSHGEDAEKYNMEPPPPPDKILALLEKFKDLPKEAEERVKTESQLRQEIRTLHGELRKAQTQQKTVATEVRVADPEAIRRAVDMVEKSYRESERGFLNRITELEKTIYQISTIANKGNATLTPPKKFQIPEGALKFHVSLPKSNTPNARPHREEVKPNPPQHAETRRIASAVESNGDLTGPQKKILKTLAELKSIGKEEPEKEMVAAWTAYSPTSGGFANILGTMRSAGLIDYPSPGRIKMTEHGTSTAGDVPYPDREEIHCRIKSTCSGPELKVLEVLIKEQGCEFTKNKIAELTGYSVTSGGFANILGALRTKGLLDYPRPGSVKASDWIFAV